MSYRIQERIAGTEQWHNEPSGESYESYLGAELTVLHLEQENDDGRPMEYRIVENW